MPLWSHGGFGPSLALALLLGVTPARAVEPLDPGYSEAPSTQREPPRRRIHSLVLPTVAAPALARLGGRVSLLLRAPRGASTSPASWQVQLRRQGTAPAQACPVRGVRPRGDLVELQVEIPPELARDVYHVRVMGAGIDDVQPNAVRILGAGEPTDFSFAVVTDHQLWDPTFRLSGAELSDGAYRVDDKEAKNLAMARQELAELALLDPDFVLHLGDISFGIDYPAEYEVAYQLLSTGRVPIFAIPGNHDAYADYVVRLRGGAVGLLTGALGCRRHLEGELTWGKGWLFISCLYGDVKQLLYADLQRDGLSYWQRQLGPPTYSFERGRLRFVALNTYDGIF